MSNIRCTRSLERRVRVRATLAAARASSMPMLAWQGCTTIDWAGALKHWGCEGGQKRQVNLILYFRMLWRHWPTIIKGIGAPLDALGRDTLLPRPPIHFTVSSTSTGDNNQGSVCFPDRCTRFHVQATTCSNMTRVHIMLPAAWTVSQAM